MANKTNKQKSAGNDERMMRNKAGDRCTARSSARGGGKGDRFLSPDSELALFFGMTSAETGGGSTGRLYCERGGARPFCSTAIGRQTRQVFLRRAPSPPYMAFRLGARGSSGWITAVDDPLSP